MEEGRRLELGASFLRVRRLVGYGAVTQGIARRGWRCIENGAKLRGESLREKIGQWRWRWREQLGRLGKEFGDWIAVLVVAQAVRQFGGMQFGLALVTGCWHSRARVVRLGDRLGELRWGGSRSESLIAGFFVGLVWLT